MAAQYLLQCECGQKIPVNVGQVGQSVTCGCGKTFYAPTMQGLTQLERLENAEVEGTAPAWNLLQRIAFVVSATIAMVSLTVVAYWAASYSSTGPAAAIRFEREYRGDMRGTFEEPYFPSGRPIPFKETTNIKPLTRNLWSQADVKVDFVAYRDTLRSTDPKSAQQLKGAIVIVKTERCHQVFRACATATAALEKHSTALLKHFRIYGAWIEINPDHRRSAWKEWEQQVIREYDFKLGPGPKICVLFPGIEKRYEADAKKLDLYIDPFERLNGKTPLLERFLKRALEYAEEKKKSEGQIGRIGPICPVSPTVL